MTVAEDLEDELFGAEDPSAESEEDLTDSITDLRNAVVWGTDWTAATIVDQIERGAIFLDPTFQRRDAWRDDRKSRFVESLILGLPIPQLVLAEHRAAKGQFIVIDGKQRLLSLSKFTGMALPDGQPPLALTGLNVRKDLNGCTYAELQNNPQHKRIVSAFENQSIRTVIIRGWKRESTLYTIFHRLNSGSLQLSPQELRQALHPGPFLTFAAKLSERSQALWTVLGLKGPDFRMRDVEFAVRFYAFQYHLHDYRGNLKQLLDDTCAELNKN